MSFASFLPMLLAQAAVEPSTPWFREGWFLLVVALAVIAAPFLVGFQLARIWRSPDDGWRIGVVLFAFVAGIVICAMGWPPKLGIDLSGGVILIYEVDSNKQQNRLMEDGQRVLDRSIAATGLRGTVEREDGRLSVVLPSGADSDLDRFENEVSGRTPGDLPLALQERTRRDDAAVLVYSTGAANTEDVDNNQLMDKLVTAITRRVNPGGQKEVTVRRYGEEQVEVIIPEVDEA